MQWFSRKSRRLRHNLAYGVGMVAGVIVMVLLILPSNAALHAHGPMNSGHEKLTCEACHQAAPGTLRQRLQANMQFLLGSRTDSVEFGHRTVGNAQCLYCHERPNERHPVYRFMEPRYAKVRQAIAPQQCRSCHEEHTGKRVTITPEVCQQCHDSLTLRKDPLQPTHADLIHQKNWSSCLGCHDFHGNHHMKAPTHVNAVIDPLRIQTYFNGGESPYPHEKYYAAKQDNEIQP